MKNIFIQKIVGTREVANKECKYLVTINKGARLEKAVILEKRALLNWLENNLPGSGYPAI